MANMTPCLNQCGVSRHVVGSASHRACQHKSGLSQPGQAVAAQPPPAAAAAKQSIWAPASKPIKAMLSKIQKVQERYAGTRFAQKHPALAELSWMGGAAVLGTGAVMGAVVAAPALGIAGGASILGGFVGVAIGGAGAALTSSQTMENAYGKNATRA